VNLAVGAGAEVVEVALGKAKAKWKGVRAGTIRMLSSSDEK
jgi:hypothetical protein